MSKMKPRPCCNGEVTVSWIEEEFMEECYYKIYSVFCPRCKLKGRDSGTEKGAIFFWNKSKDGWISIDDGMPEYEESTHLDVFMDGEITRAYWVPSHKEFAFTHGMVTHWRLKPQPPIASTPPTRAGETEV